MDFYKEIDKSIFEGKFTIPESDWGIFIDKRKEKWGKGTRREVKVIFKNKVYSGKYIFVQQSTGRRVFQISFDGDLIKKLKEEFIQSFIAIESQKILHTGGKFRTKLNDENKEGFMLRVLNKDEIELIPNKNNKGTPYDGLFKQLVKANVFGWLSSKKREKIITKYTEWIDISELPEHKFQNHVIYYLIDEKNKQLYIGSATKLGNRVKEGREEIPGWNKFMYAIVHPKFHANLLEIENHTIMSFGRIMKNSKNIKHLNLSNYTLVNKQYPKSGK